MLEQLVVSGSHRRESRKFRGFFLGTATLVLTGCFSVFVWSIMAADLTLNDDGLELSAVITPVPIPAVEPPKPEPPQQQREQQAAKNDITTRQADMDRVDNSHVIPDNISTAPNTQRERPKNGIPFHLGRVDNDASGGNNPARGNGGGPAGSFDPGTISGNGNKDDDGVKPPVMPKKDPDPPKRPVAVSGGVLNGEARSLPKPIYPAPAKQMNISDSVSVQVVIDEKGNVISAKAVSGNQMLRTAAEVAARQAKFGTTYLTGQPVKVTGVIVYKFSNG
jgi:protein TonB